MKQLPFLDFNDDDGLRVLFKVSQWLFFSVWYAQSIEQVLDSREL